MFILVLPENEHVGVSHVGAPTEYHPAGCR